MASLFLSYSRADASRVGPLAAALEGDGHKVWWDRHITGGDEFADAIERALESAEVVIACWTEHSVHSGWVRDEAAVGRDKGLLVPVSLDGCLPPLGFRQYHTIGLVDWNGQPESPDLDSLRAAIAEKASGTSQPRAVPPARASPGALVSNCAGGISPRPPRWHCLPAAPSFTPAFRAGPEMSNPRLPLGSSPWSPRACPGNFRICLGRKSSPPLAPRMPSS